MNSLYTFKLEIADSRRVKRKWEAFILERERERNFFVYLSLSNHESFLPRLNVGSQNDQDHRVHGRFDKCLFAASISRDAKARVYMRPLPPLHPSSENELHKASQLSKITRSFNIDFAIKIPLAAGDTRHVNPRRELVRGDTNRGGVFNNTGIFSKI